MVGVGSMGASACYYLSKQGIKVLGIERHSIPHEQGSYTGKTRIIRKAYFENKAYVPLLDRAYKNWNELETRHDQKLVEFTGLLYAGLPDSELLDGVRQSAGTYQIPIQKMTQNDQKERYPQFNIPEGFDVLFEKNAGYVYADKTVKLLAEQAVLNGATIHENEEMKRWEKTHEGNISVTTNKATYLCDKVVFCAGSWSHKLLDKIELHITKQLLFWLDVEKNNDFAQYKFPCWIIDEPSVDGSFYGFPIVDGSQDVLLNQLKIGHHVKGTPIDPNEHGQHAAKEIDQVLVDKITRVFSDLKYTNVQSRSCMYSNSKDDDFYLDFLDDEKQIVVAAGFSGHGFKFVPVIGEIITDLITTGSTPFDIDFLSISRH